MAQTEAPIRRHLRPGTRPGRVSEGVIRTLLFLCGLVSVFTTAGIIYSLLSETILFFRHVSIVEFFTETRWAPLFKPTYFGVLPLVAGTTLIAFGAMVVSLPLGLGAAVFLSEYAPSGVRRVMKPLLEVLAGIPTVVYGYFALYSVTPLLRTLLPRTEIFNAASAAIVMGVMVLPMIASLSEDAMMAVPRSLREGAYALGATRLEVSTQVVVPAALSGIVAAIIMAVSRAVGETMIVAIAAGSTPKLTLNPLESIQTMTAFIAQVSLGDTPHGTIEYQTIFAVGALLFVMTLGMNAIAQWVKQRYWRAAE